MLNPRKFALRKWLVDLIGENRFSKHDQIVERLGTALSTAKDTEDFGKFAVDVYEAGYMKCLVDCQKKLEGLNIKINLIS